MKNMTKWSVAALLGSALFGCSAQDGGSDTGGDLVSAENLGEIEVDGSVTFAEDAEVGQEVGRSVLAELDVAGALISFVENTTADGQRFVVLEVIGTSAAGSPVHDIQADQPLTMLEIFMALAPAGSEAPSPLRDVHSEQAAALGREDIETVLEVDYDSDAPVLKSSATCSTLIFEFDPDDWTATNRHALNSQSGIHTHYVGGSSSFRTTKWVTVGMCNEGTTWATALPSFDMDGDATGWQNAGQASNPSLGFNVPPNGGYFLYFPWRMNVGYECGIIDCLYPTRYRVKGNGVGPYHLKSAELDPVLPPIK